MQTTDRIVIFKRLKKILEKYENPLVPKTDLDSRYDLWSIKIQDTIKKWYVLYKKKGWV